MVQFFMDKILNSYCAILFKKLQNVESRGNNCKDRSFSIYPLNKKYKLK